MVRKRKVKKVKTPTSTVLRTANIQEEPAPTIEPIGEQATVTSLDKTLVEINEILDEAPELPWTYTNRFIEETFRPQYDSLLIKLRAACK